MIMRLHPRNGLRAFVGVVLGLLTAISSPHAEPRSAVPILVYHSLGPRAVDGMTVTTTVFEENIAWLKAHGYRIIPLRRLIDALRDPGQPLPEHAVVITADDGRRSVYTEMLPIIRREQIPVTLFIYPSAISNADYALTWDELAEIAKTGLVEIESHTYWHPNFQHEAARLSAADYQAFVMRQLTLSRQVLRQRLGGTVDMLAWPFGIHDPQLEQWAKDAGYQAAFTIERAGAARGEDLLALPRFLMTNLDRGARFAALIENTEPLQ